MSNREPTSAQVMSLKKAGDMFIPFGRYKGQTVRDVSEVNRKYLEWMEENCQLSEYFKEHLTLWLDFGHRENS